MWIPATKGKLLPAGTTKGDLAVFDGTDWVRVGVGSDDQVLTADSAQTEGVKWATGGGGGGSGATELIEEIALASDTTTVLFDEIPGTFSDLLITGVARSTRASTLDGGLIRFGTGGGSVDTGANYDGYRFGDVNLVGIDRGVQSGGTSGWAGFFTIAGDNASADVFSPYRVEIPGYAGTGFNKVWEWQASVVDPNDARMVRGSGVWDNTGAIDSVALLLVNADWKSGSVFRLYGVG